MASDGSCLGVCYSDNQLFYSVGNSEHEGHLTHIGSIDFNFGVENAIITGSEPGFPALKTSLLKLKETYNCNSVKILSPAKQECWTIVPRSVYEDASEREAHIQLLMHGYDRSNIQVTWHPVSNDENKLLLIRNSATMNGFNHLLGSFGSSEYMAEFEVGYEWTQHKGNKGSYLMVHCQTNHISLSSFILGKLRGCTYIKFESKNDLPYFWNLYAEDIPWMTGIHDKMYLFGQGCQKIAEILQPHIEGLGKPQIMNNLGVMHVDADEKTYGFDLEMAFPAIMLSLNKGTNTARS